MKDTALLEKLTQLWGVAGYEKPVREFILKETEGLGDEVITDALAI